MKGKILTYLEYRSMEENSDKFWSVVDVNGMRYLRYGRIGTVGQTRMASDIWFSKATEKMRQGYVRKDEATGLEFDYSDGYGSQQWQDAVDRAIAGLSGGVVINPLESFQGEVVAAMQNARSNPDGAFEAYGVLSQQMTEIKASYDQCEGYLSTLRDILTATGATS